ncbi:xanthine phosphoribosyltransferase [Neisseriaceae bacterium JH1-16]|jgi:xanthine phosphoribosyltransferase|nr:xanthine phosphoribosyltransferase [Neisseriaceae bacterium JH1-16]
MEQLKHKILTEGRLLDGFVLKVDNFLNHQLDVELLDAMGEEFARRFAGVQIDKILTIEASGIAVAAMAARHFGYPPVVFAKKTQSLNLDADAFETEVYSFTKQQVYKVRVSRRYLQPGERVLIIDDFLAHGHATRGLIDIVKQAGAEPAGVGIVIEKGFQGGGKLIRDAGVRLESLAVLKAIADGKIEFA